VTVAINLGEPVPIPDEVTAMLIDKRMKEIAARRYTKIHRRFTVSRRKDQAREKMKRTMQKELPPPQSGKITQHLTFGRKVQGDKNT